MKACTNMSIFPTDPHNASNRLLCSAYSQQFATNVVSDGSNKMKTNVSTRGWMVVERMFSCEELNKTIKNLGWKKALKGSSPISCSKHDQPGVRPGYSLLCRDINFAD